MQPFPYKITVNLEQECELRSYHIQIVALSGEIQ